MPKGVNLQVRSRTKCAERCCSQDSALSAIWVWSNLCRCLVSLLNEMLSLSPPWGCRDGPWWWQRMMFITILVREYMDHAQAFSGPRLATVDDFDDGGQNDDDDVCCPLGERLKLDRETERTLGCIEIPRCGTNEGCEIAVTVTSQSDTHTHKETKKQRRAEKAAARARTVSFDQRETLVCIK